MKMKLACFLCLFVRLFAGGMLFGQTNPVPFVNLPLVPTSVAPGSSGFTLTVNGTGFVSGSVVNWNGSSRTTTFVSTSQLTASILATDVAVASTATVTVSNPSSGARVSNPQAFTVVASRSTLFFSASSMAAGTQPSSTRIADLNGDGIADIVVTNPVLSNANTVSVLLGNGDGTFQNEVQYPTGLAPLDVAIADFNGDGKLDLAIANISSSANSVSIFLGDGDGTFGPHVDYAAGDSPQALVAADLNGDGKMDLVVGNNTESGGISILLGNGDGTFQQYSSYANGVSQTYAVAVGDFNHDGILDVVTANTGGNSVSLLLGKGDGTFQPHVDFPVGDVALALSVADFNGDGNLDVAVSNANSNSVSILLGNGNGTFQPQVQYATENGPYGITSIDVNGDGKLDLAVATEGSPLKSVSILLGNGDGTFQPHVDYDSGGASQISAWDFNNDGLIDFSVVNTGITTLIQDQGTVVVLSPSSLVFATQMVGTVSPAQTLTLTNTGATTLTITSLTVGTVNFALANKCHATLFAGKSCKILVYFTPTAQGNLSDTISIYDNGGGSPQHVPLSGTATIVSLSPKSLDFGSIMVGRTSSPQRVTLTNRGGAKITISKIAVAGIDPLDFTQINACGTSLGAGTSCTIDVWFTPKATGSRGASLNITDTGGGSPQRVALAGTGK